MSYRLIHQIAPGLLPSSGAASLVSTDWPQQRGGGTAGAGLAARLDEPLVAQHDPEPPCGVAPAHVQVDGPDEDGGIASLNVNHVLEVVVRIARRMVPLGVHLTESYGDVPRLTCNAALARQLFLNLLLDTVRSRDGSGTLEISTASHGDWLRIAIHDARKVEDRPGFADSIFDSCFGAGIADTRPGSADFWMLEDIVAQLGGRLTRSRAARRDGVLEVHLRHGKPIHA